MVSSTLFYHRVEPGPIRFSKIRNRNLSVNQYRILEKDNCWYLNIVRKSFPLFNHATKSALIKLLTEITLSNAFRTRIASLAFFLCSRKRADNLMLRSWLLFQCVTNETWCQFYYRISTQIIMSRKFYIGLHGTWRENFYFEDKLGEGLLKSVQISKRPRIVFT